MGFFRKLWRCFFVWRFEAASDEELRSADAIVTQAVSRLRDGQPGPGNELLAQVTRSLAERYNLPVLAQEEIPMADPSLPCVYVAGGSKTGASTPYWNTRSVARQQAEVCRARGWRRVIVVAHYLHMGRALWAYEKLGLEVLPAQVPRRGYTHPDAQKWAKRSERRNEIFGRVREIALRLAFLLLGKI